MRWRDHVDPAALHLWNTPCEALFCYLASQFPDDLAALVRSETLQSQELTLALEFLGRIHDSTLVRPLLIQYLGHDEAVVREGAILGIGPHMTCLLVPILETMSRDDVSEAVRAAALDVLEDYQDSTT